MISLEILILPMVVENTLPGPWLKVKNSHSQRKNEKNSGNFLFPVLSYI